MSQQAQVVRRFFNTGTIGRSNPIGSRRQFRPGPFPSRTVDADAPNASRCNPAAGSAGRVTSNACASRMTRVRASSASSAAIRASNLRSSSFAVVTALDPRPVVTGRR